MPKFRLANRDGVSVTRAARRFFVDTHGSKDLSFGAQFHAAVLRLVLSQTAYTGAGELKVNHQLSAILVMIKLMNLNTGLESPSNDLPRAVRERQTTLRQWPAIPDACDERLFHSLTRPAIPFHAR